MLKKIALTGALFLSGCATQASLNEQEKPMDQSTNALPGYVVINDDTQSAEQKSVLREHAAVVSFPLSEDDQRDVRILEAKYDQEKNMAGLAAPQIGISKKMIIFAAPDDEELQKWRPDLVQFMPKTIWLNASYEGVGTEKTKDYEACFSVKELAAPVWRFNTIRYTANLEDGTPIEGQAVGFLARIIQHEIDHTEGTLFIDLVEDNDIMTMEAYKALRKQRREEMKQHAYSQNNPSS